MKLSIVGGRADEKTGVWINRTKVDYIIISIERSDIIIRESEGRILITASDGPLTIQPSGASGGIRILPGKQE